MKRDVINFLKRFISIPSVSSDSKRKSEMEKAASFLKAKLASIGFKTKILKRKNAHPFIFAYYKASSTKNTLAFYGHYDVQPEDPVEEWETSPFELVVKNGKFWGRGVADNKGHITINLFAAEELIKNDLLRSNLIFLLEGEEELGSPNFESYVKSLKSELKDVDVFFLTDVGMHKKGVPQIFYGLRGLVYFELEVEVGKRDLHSGVYGNRVINPANLLCEILAKMKDAKTNKVLIPGFYKDVRKLTKLERELLLKIKKSDKEEKAEAGVYSLVSLDKQNPSLTSKTYPSLDINGIVSGFTGEGTKTIIPRRAIAKFSCRLVEHQNPEKIVKLIESFIKKHMPKGVKWEIKKYDSAAPFYTSIENPWVKRTAKALKDVFGKEPVYNRSGGTIPAAEILQRLFKKPIVLTGFTLPDDNIHAPNENFDEESFWKGMEAIRKILISN